MGEVGVLLKVELGAVASPTDYLSQSKNYTRRTKGSTTYKDPSVQIEPQVVMYRMALDFNGGRYTSSTSCRRKRVAAARSRLNAFGL